MDSQIGFSRVEEFLSVEDNGSGRDAATLAGIGHGGQPQGGFASSGFANEAENLAFFECQVEALDDRFPGFTRQPIDHDIFHLKQWFHEFFFLVNCTDQSSRPLAICRNQSTIRLTPTVKKAMAPAGHKGV